MITIMVGIDMLCRYVARGLRDGAAAGRVLGAAARAWPHHSRASADVRKRSRRTARRCLYLHRSLSIMRLFAIYIHPPTLKPHISMR